MFGQFLALIRREFCSWLYRPVFYSHCVLFSFFALAAMFLLGNFVEANEAELTFSFFRWIPWVFAVTAPVIGIACWSEETHNGVFEVLGTQPVRTGSLVLAKAMGAFTVVLISLGLTFPAVLTVMWLGKPDMGVIASGYLGALFCGGAFAATSMAVCIFMKVSIGAFVCSAAFNLLLITCGVSRIADLILNSFPGLTWMTNLLASISILPKYEPFADGRVQLAAIIGFLLIILASLLICTRALLAQRGSPNRSGFLGKVFDYGAPIWLVLGSYVLLALGSSQLRGQLDWTESRIFGLPPAVATALNEMERKVTVRLFATERHPEFGFERARYLRRIREMMDLIVRESKNQVRFQQLDPNLDTTAAQIAAIDEVRSFSVGNAEPMMFGMVIGSLDQKRVLNEIDPQREQHFLRDLVQGILDVGTADRKRIGILTPFTSLRKDMLAFEFWTGIKVLQNRYDVEFLDARSDLGQPDILMLIHQSVSDPELCDKLESYLEAGGDLVIFADPYSLMAQTFGESDQAELESSRLPDFVHRRGLKLVKNRLVYDFLLATQHASEEGAELNPAIMGLNEACFNPSHSISAGFDYVHFCLAGAIDVTTTNGFTSTELVRSSNQAALADPEIAIHHDNAKLDHVYSQLKPLEFGHPLMVLQTSDDPNQGRLLVAGDVDWLYGTIAGVEDSGGRLESINANVGLAQNAIDFLAGDRSLHELRMRSLEKRPLMNWDAMRQEIGEPFREPIAQLSEKLGGLEAKIESLIGAQQVADRQKVRFENQLGELTREARTVDAELTSLRSQREAKVELRVNIIKWMNILTTPLLAALFGAVITLVRKKRTRGKIL